MQNTNVETLFNEVKKEFVPVERRIRLTGQEVRMNVDGLGNHFFDKVYDFKKKVNCKVNFMRSGTGIVIIFSLKSDWENSETTQHKS